MPGSLLPETVPKLFSFTFGILRILNIGEIIWDSREGLGTFLHLWLSFRIYRPFLIALFCTLCLATQGLGHSAYRCGLGREGLSPWWEGSYFGPGLTPLCKSLPVPPTLTSPSWYHSPRTILTTPNEWIQDPSGLRKRLSSFLGRWWLSCLVMGNREGVLVS